jgi:hypothetical protein
MAIGVVEAELKQGTRTVINPVTNTVATTSTQVALNNPNRIFLMIVNNGATDMYVGFDRQVSSSRGIRVPNSGGVFSVSWREDYELCFSEVFAVAVTSSVNVYVLELVVTGRAPGGGT